MTSPIITLTTDFGSRDGYAAAVKGAILSVHRDVTIVDVSHDVPPQDVAHGAFLLGAACPYFPPDAVHLAVVDPGVGAERLLILLVTPHGSYLAPDNGLLTHVLMAHEDGGEIPKVQAKEVPDGCRAYSLDRREYWLHRVSDTFHGRDILAPVAAHLAAGVPPEDLGEPLDSLVRLAVPRPRSVDGWREGQVIYVDRFGNLVSNIRMETPTGWDGFEVGIGGALIRGLSRSYAGADGLLAIVGSSGYLEVAAKNGSAARQLAAGVGSKVVLRPAGDGADG